MLEYKDAEDNVTKIITLNLIIFHVGRETRQYESQRCGYGDVEIEECLSCVCVYVCMCVCVCICIYSCVHVWWVGGQGSTKFQRSTGIETSVNVFP